MPGIEPGSREVKRIYNFYYKRDNLRIPDDSRYTTSDCLIVRIVEAKASLVAARFDLQSHDGDCSEIRQPRKRRTRKEGQKMLLNDADLDVGHRKSQ